MTTVSKENMKKNVKTFGVIKKITFGSFCQKNK